MIECVPFSYLPVLSCVAEVIVEEKMCLVHVWLMLLHNVNAYNLKQW